VPVQPHPPTAPPIAPPTRGWRVVGQAQVEKLDHADARKAVEELLKQLAADPKLRTDVLWRLYEPEKGG
jgi:hypothetical protein